MMLFPKIPIWLIWNVAQKCTFNSYVRWFCLRVFYIASSHCFSFLLHLFSNFHLPFALPVFPLPFSSFFPWLYPLPLIFSFFFSLGVGRVGEVSWRVMRKREESKSCQFHKPQTMFQNNRRYCSISCTPLTIVQRSCHPICYSHAS